jgi:hypothetical protein
VSVPALAFRGRRPGRRGSASAPPEPSGPTFNVSALPVSNRQVTDWAWHQSASGPGGCAGGAATLCPVTGLYSLRLTSASYPVANTSGQLDYASTGSHISLPDDEGNVYVCVSATVAGTSTYFIKRLVRGAPPSVASEVQAVVQPGRDTVNTFSRNPATPWLLLVLVESPSPRIRAIDVRTNTEVTSVNGMTFPLLLPALNAGGCFWLTANDDTTRVCAYASGGGGTVAVYNTLTGALVRSEPFSFFNAASGVISTFNECSIDPTGRYVSVRYNQSRDATVWDIDTGFLSANFAGVSAQASHASWVLASDGPYIVADDSSDGFIGRQRHLKAQPITSAGSSAGTYENPNPAQVLRTCTQHTSSFWSRSGVTGPQQYTLGSPRLVATTHPTPGTWSSLGGGVWQTTADISGSIRQATGIVDVWQCGTIGPGGFGDAVRTLTRRENGTTSLNADEWAVDAASGTTQVVRVRLADGMTPNGRVHLATSALNNHAVALVRLDNADSRIVARSHSLPYTGDFNVDYAAMEKPQIGPGAAPWVLYNTNHGIQNGRVDVIAVQLPVS